MGKTRRKFSLEFKQQILAEIASGQKSLGQAAREYQVSASVINRWRAHADQNQLSATPSARERALEAENERLKAKIGDLVMQNDFLKKFQSFVQRQKSVDSSVISGKNWDQLRKRAK
ncbi:MAG TPA: transposase [Acidobacteriota bacterium]|jgi:transposase-like protein